LRLRLFFAGAITVTAAALLSHNSLAVTFGQLDDFQDGTVMGWSQGAPSPNPTSNVNTGGPAGAGDQYLLNVSSGLFGAGGKQAMFNRVQWTGNFNAAGVTRVRLNLANFGTNNLAIRVAVEGAAGTWYASTNPIPLPVNSGWTSQLFDLTASNLSLVGGGQTLSDVLDNVIEMRILSNQLIPSFRGDVIAGQLGVDNVRAMRLEGDANFDGIVDTLDFNALAANFGGTNKTWNQADFNFDGKVDTLDFNFLAANFGKSVGSDNPGSGGGGALVPEPATVSIIAIAYGCLFKRRNRHR
jgi:hypothetical protein